MTNPKKKIQIKKSWIYIFLALVALLFIISRCNANKTTSEDFVVARDPTWEPLSLLGKEINVLGFSDELFAEIGNRERIHINLVAGRVNTLYSGLDNGSYDGIITALRPSPQSFSRYVVSEPFFVVGPVLLVNAESSITSLDQLGNKILGVLRNNTVSYEWNPNVIIVPYDDATKALDDLSRNAIDGVILNILPAHAYTHSLYEGKVKIVTKPLNDIGLRLITLKSKRGEKLQTDFERGLQFLRQSGEYDALLQRWELVAASM